MSYEVGIKEKKDADFLYLNKTFDSIVKKIGGVITSNDSKIKYMMENRTGSPIGSMVPVKEDLQDLAMVPVQEDLEEEVEIDEGKEQSNQDSLKKPKAEGTVDSVLDDTVVKQTTDDAEDNNVMLKLGSPDKLCSPEFKNETEMINIKEQDST